MIPVKIAIVDDQTLFLKGLRLILECFPEIEIVIEVDNGTDFLQAVETTPPDVVLLDLRMPGMDGIEVAEQLKQKAPQIKIILLTMHDDERFIHHVLSLGANGYLLKNEEPDILRQAIQKVMTQEYYLNDYVAKALLNNLKRPNSSVANKSPEQFVSLTRREKEILELICNEKTTAEIAEQLYISKRTVEGHRQNMLDKTGVRNAAGLVIYAMKNRLI